MNLFLLPIHTLNGFSEDSVRSWISVNIIPKVQIERESFLSALPKKIAKKADPFSFKYLAFVLHTGSIEFDTQNRKFATPLMETLLSSQVQRNVAHMAQELTDIVRTKDFF